MKQHSTSPFTLQCPPLPQTLLEAVELSNVPDGPEVDQVVDMVEHDPAVVSRLLRVVNSAYFGQRGTIQSVQRAVVIMGPPAVVGMVMSMGLMEVQAVLDDKTTAPFLNLVRHSIATAYLGKGLLLKGEKPEFYEQAFTAGLLHDFGKVVLLYTYPVKAGILYALPPQEVDSPDDMLRIEKARLGHDHVEAGAYFTDHHNLPEGLATTISYHHRSDRGAGMDREHRHVLYTVTAANRATSALGYASDFELSWEDCCHDPIWDRMVEERVGGWRDRDALLDTLQSLREDLQGYVDAIT